MCVVPWQCTGRRRPRRTAALGGYNSKLLAMRTYLPAGIVQHAIAVGEGYRLSGLLDGLQLALWVRRPGGLWAIWGFVRVQQGLVLSTIRERQLGFACAQKR